MTLLYHELFFSVFTECDFESHKCDWSNSSNWIFWKGSTETPSTGPSSDHSTVDGRLKKDINRSL